MLEYYWFKRISNVRVVWIVNNLVGVGWCNAPEGKVAAAVYGK